MDKNHDVKTIIFKTFKLRKPRVADFADIIKIATMFIKTKKEFKKVKSIRNYVLKCNLFLYFLI